MLKKLVEVTTGVLPAVIASNAGGRESEQTGQSRVEQMEELALPNNKIIIRLLSEHEGWMWQRDIVVKTGWSKSKTSRILCEVEEDGEIIRYQRGREKIVCIPGHEPTKRSFLLQ